MTRINVYSQPDEYGTPELAGWFDPDTAECFPEDARWDGSNMIGVMSGSQWVDECLYRTAGSEWVRRVDATRCYGGPDAYEFVSDEQARDWLLRNGDDEAAARFFGPVEEERGPGRPGIGGRISTSLGDDLLSMVDAYAADRRIARAEAIRRLLTDAVTRARTAGA